MAQDDKITAQKRVTRVDMNLPDESAGKPVGQLGFAEKSKDSLKQAYRDRLKKKPLDIQQEEQSRIIFGGDADDPRWKEFNERLAASKKANQKKD